MLFENYRTIEQLKAQKLSKQAQPISVYKKDAEGNKVPVYYSDAQGNPTNVQKITLKNEAKQTIAWCSMSLAKAIRNGERPAILVVDCIDDNGNIYPDRACLAGKLNDEFDGLMY